MSKWGRVKEFLIEKVFLLSASLSIVVLAGIFILLLLNALPAFRAISPFEFFFSTNWNPASYFKPSYGILAQVASTFMVTFGALSIAVPFGILTAAYVSEIAGPKEKEILKPIIEMLAAVPSVVIGFIGIVVVGPLIARVFNLNSGLNALNGSVLLSLMALPTIISISEDALNMVPSSYKEASYALGADKWQTLFKVTVPAAISGITAAVMLGMGRAIGETITVLMVTGNAPAFPTSLFESVRTMTANIAIELGEVPYYTTHYHALFAVGLVLFIITFIVNLTADMVMHRK